MSEPRKKRGPVSYSTYQEAKDRIAELEATICRISGGESMGRIALLEAVAEAAVIVCQLVDEKASMVYGLLERPLRAAGYLGVGDE